MYFKIISLYRDCDKIIRGKNRVHDKYCAVGPVVSIQRVIVTTGIRVNIIYIRNYRKSSYYVRVSRVT